MNPRAWLEFFRIHTVALTGSVCILGYVVSGGSLFSLEALLWFIFGLLFHAFGFSHNNLCDFRYDVEDPAKQHFPLGRGEISYFWASEVNRYGLVLLALFAAYLTGLRPMALVFLFLTMTAGFCYNWVCKRSLLAPIPISLCFGLLAGVPYFSTSNVVSPLMLVVFGYGVAQISFQIGWEGYAKDLESDKINLIRFLGGRIERVSFPARFKPSTKSKVYAWASKLPMLPLGLVVWMCSGSGQPALTGFVALTLAAFWSAHQLIKERLWVHKRTVMFCALCEMLTYYALVSALEGVLGPLGVLVMIFFPTSWFLIFNYIYWGRVITPKV